MRIGKAGHPRDLLVEARVVLHRAAAEREEAEVDGVVLTAEARIVAHRFGLAKPRQADRRGARERTKIGGGCILVKIDAGGLAAADLEDQRFLEHQRAVAGEGDIVIGAAGAVHFGAPAGAVERRSEEHTSELQSLMRISYAVFCLKK